jgi:hypothetical protein
MRPLPLPPLSHSNLFPNSTLFGALFATDPIKPARGVVLSYSGIDGDSVWCPGRNRTFSIELQCSTALGNKASFQSASVVETNTCDYRVQLQSLAGCPLECITGNTFCNGNGICGWNTDAQRNQCFCNAGASGSQCSAHPSASKALSPEGIILIIVCLMLAGVLGLVGFMFHKLRKLQVDPSAYGDLQGKCAYIQQETPRPLPPKHLSHLFHLSSAHSHTTRMRHALFCPFFPSRRQ